MKEQIEKRLELLITISIFFSVLVYNLSKIIEQNDTGALSLGTQFSFLAGFYILNYVLFQLRKDELSEKSLRRIAKWLLACIGIFVVPIFGIALATVPLENFIGISIALISNVFIYIIVIIPAIGEIIILFSGEKKEKRKWVDE